MARNRIIYASQSVWANGEILYRVQTLGTSTTFTSEDIFELGQLNIVDVVDDVPAVAVTLNTNDFGDVKTFAILAQVAKARLDMKVTATASNANLKSGATFLHGACLADFAIVCGNLPGISMWAPVQSECDMGTLAENIDQTMYLDKVFVNSIEFSYSVGANATENYGAETDNKMWLLNDGRFVNFDRYTADMVGSKWIDANGTGSTNLTSFRLSDTTVTVATLSGGVLGFLRKNPNGEPSVSYYKHSAQSMTNIAVKLAADPDYSATRHFKYDPTTRTFTVPTNLSITTGDMMEVVYAGNKYTSGNHNTYFNQLSDATRPESIGALRQGQVEVYIVDPSIGATAYENTWRLSSVSMSADLTREPLIELGHLAPYDRPLTLPIPINITVESTAGDLENWARFAGLVDDFNTDSIDDINLAHLMNKDDLILVVKVFQQTDEEASGTGSARKVTTEGLIGKNFFIDGKLNNGATPYASLAREYALKTIVVKNLKITSEGNDLAVGSNATQSFGFKANNDLFVLKGDVSIGLLAGLQRNATV